MGIQINGNTNNINAGIGSLSIEDIRELDITGIATASNFKTGTSNVHSTGYECTNVNATGVITATSFVPATDNAHDLGTSSVRFRSLYSHTLYGNGSNLTNLPAQVSITGNADNRVITGGSGVNLNAESGLTYNGQAFQINSVTSENNAFRILNTTDNSVRYQINGEGNSFIGHTYPRADASIDLGFHSGYRWRDVVLSGGIRFGSANSTDYLDDYEEGSFTPQFDGLSNTPTYAARNGRYTKIGRYVHITGIIQTGGTNPQFTTTSNILKVTGLPYAGSGIIYYVSVGNVSQQHWSWAGSGNNEMGYSAGDIDFFNCQMENNTSTMIFVLGKGGNTRSRVRNASMHNNGAIIIFELSYTV